MDQHDRQDGQERNGTVDAADYVVWRNQLLSAQSQAAAIAASMPETTGLRTAISGVLGVMGLQIRGTHVPASFPCRTSERTVEPFLRDPCDKF